MFRKLNEPDRSTLTIYIDGEPVEAESGETVAAVLLRQPSLLCRTTPVNESPRAPFCMMGVCFDCLVIVDGVASTQSCLVSVQQGMRIERQFGRRSLLS
jgi:predicted molibdopterin-dependent oxidoreductase YjgC